MTMTSTAQQQVPPQVAHTSSRPIRIYKHYDLFYWWIVWLYAGAAWLWTYMYGVVVKITDKDIKFAAEPLVGIGFVGVLLFVAIFTAVRARGPMSFILFVCLIMAGVAMQWFGVWRQAMQQFPELRLHLNGAFYGMVFCVLFPVWFLTTFIFNRMHYFTFDHGRQVGEINPMGGGTKTFTAQNVSVVKMADDIFVHRVLGLWWLGFGTGDVILSYSDPGGGAHREVITNVWRVDYKIREINKRIQ